MSKRFRNIVLVTFFGLILNGGCAHDPAATPEVAVAGSTSDTAVAASADPALAEATAAASNASAIVTEAVPVPGDGPVQEAIRVPTASIMPPDATENASPDTIDDGAVSPPPALPTEEQLMAQYRIGPMDVLEFRSFDDETLNTSVTVRHDGYISLPWIADVKVAGQTRDEATALVREAYQALYFEAEVSLQITEAMSKTFTVMGDVTAPAEYPYTRPITLIDSIIAAGSLRVNQRGGDSFVGGQGQLVKALIIRPTGEGRSITEYDLRNMEQGGSRAHDAFVPVLPGDLVYVPEGLNLVYVLGAVGRPGIQPLSDGMTMLQFLASVGGINEDIARMKQIVLIREVDEEKTELQLLDVRMMLRTGQDIKIHPGDIIYVPQKRLINLATMINASIGIVSPIIGITSQVAGLYTQAYDAFYADNRVDLLYNDLAGNNQIQTNLQLLEAIRDIGEAAGAVNGTK